MPSPSADVLPVSLSDGWPDVVPGCVLTLREAGIVLGGLLLEEDEWRALQSRQVMTVRIDEHPLTDGWTTRTPDGTESSVEFEIPTVPVVVPAEALRHSRAFEEWVLATHGALGRLLIWDASRRWWIVNEPDLELFVTCAPSGMFSEESDELSWLPIGTAAGRQAVENLKVRYGLTSQN